MFSGTKKLKKKVIKKVSCNFSVRALTVFSKENFEPKMKIPPSKVVHNRPQLFFQY